MQLQQFSNSVIKVGPPPLWYVTNGDLTVGPVVTDLLKRGVEHGRVPEYCKVRHLRGHWRGLNTVREIAALQSKAKMPAPSAEQLAEWGDLFDRKQDGAERAQTAAWLALVATGAESAMLHCRGARGTMLFTRAVVGPVSTERLGYQLPETDLLVVAARRGSAVFGPPYGPAEDALVERFASTASDVSAVAMIPVFVGRELTVMLELARPGHEFRRVDLRRAERIVQRALIRDPN